MNTGARLFPVDLPRRDLDALRHRHFSFYHSRFSAWPAHTSKPDASMNATIVT
jgi:hypothetical protein